MTGFTGNVPEDYVGQESFFEGEAPLSLGIGYAIVLGFGVFFSLFTLFLVWLDKKFNGTEITSEQFNTAGRSVKTGLTAAVIVSQWTWAATLLQSSNVAFAYGVSGPFWYASGASIQVLLFGVLAIEVKRKAPTAHTFLEIIQARWGNTAHKVFLFFAFLTNIIVTSMLLLGGSATVNALCGMDINLASFLIPFGVIAYTMAGGLKATFLASYVHTAIIFIALCIFIFLVYTNPESGIGSADAMYDKLQAVAGYSSTQCEEIGNLDACGGVVGNEEGSYLTMLSREGLIFGIINIVGNFGTVFVDQSYWQSAFAAKPSSSHTGYLMGGLVWFTIPFALATSLGLAVVALQLPVTADEAGAGLVPPAAATYMLGKGGAVLIACMLFMAITSTGSAELIAVSSLVTYDIYRAYIKPTATGEDILRVSRIVIGLFGVFMGLLAVILNQIGLSLGYVYLMMGVIIGSAVMPVAYCILWKKCTATGAITGAVVGQILAIITWISTAHGEFGEVSLASTGSNYPMLAGNLVAILSSGLICTVISLMNPDDYQFEETRAIKQVEEDKSGLSEEDLNEELLNRSQKWIVKWGSIFTIIIVILWPVFSLPAGVFSKGYFGFWVAVSMIWGLVATIAIIGLPLLESVDSIKHVVYGLLGWGLPPTAADFNSLQCRVMELEKMTGMESAPNKEAPVSGYDGTEAKDDVNITVAAS
jgi:SSS family transporter|mmetsp:Transcript_7346/g.11055  ORF Transcript_7346/g.11055 Transcript_7346/m.11055 type:complete len:704 (-) Transcript_7346:203-2314(-)|eukprot:CAMPEP_0113944162 /NCGR_PEP_ID=MMETSP1339-20121228/30667_1 /TAXON_ID=94617 /ORGANISM="Fibrocapsa japonica" /LENGTH=703 /DNA_ID=CAMNT_0000949249 /DNA_START=83 /DNA_END=2194 /DNA_ORIENTATION=+ /assembly_acc=CAM_ASM_000762